MSVVALQAPQSAPAAALPHNLDAEASVLGGIILRNAVLAELDDLETGDFYDFKHRVAFEAVRNLEAAGKPIDVVTLETEIDKVGKLDAIGGVAFLGELAMRVPTPDNVRVYRDEVLLLSRNRQAILALSSALTRAQRWPHDAADLLPELVGELGRIVEADPARQSARTPWRRCRELVDAIVERTREPWVALQLDACEVVQVRLGGIVLLIGATGRGKTSLAATLLVEHAQRSGPALSVSLELTGDEWTARAIGIRTGASWAGVLRGELAAGQMLGALPERLAIIEREAASISALERAIDDLQREYPGEPVLVAVDYVQLVGADGDDEIRPRIGKVMRMLDKVARSKRAVLIALSQGSRASSRALNSGEKLGSETTDSGAESADLERWATVTLAIGQLGTEDEDGTCGADLSLGKSRMGGGDRVLPARYHGPSGRWTVAGEARAASDVRAERATQKDSARTNTVSLAVEQLLSRAPAPMHVGEIREELRARRDDVSAALTALRRAGSIVRVRGAKRGGHWPVWTAERAREGGLDVVPEVVE